MHDRRRGSKVPHPRQRCFRCTTFITIAAPPVAPLLPSHCPGSRPRASYRVAFRPDRERHLATATAAAVFELFQANVAQGFAEVRFGSASLTALSTHAWNSAISGALSRFRRDDRWSTLSPFAGTLRFRIDVKELGVDPQTVDRAMVATAQRSDQAAPGTRMTAATLGPCALQRHTRSLYRRSSIKPAPALQE